MQKNRNICVEKIQTKYDNIGLCIACVHNVTIILEENQKFKIIKQIKCIIFY